MQRFFRIEKLRATANPQQVCWLAMHQDYTGEAVIDSISKCPNETKAGEYLIDHCLKYSHWGILEHPAITFNAVGFPHHTVMQLRTHRVGISFDVSSLRYCSKHILDVADGQKDVEEVFYLRPVGAYTDRQGKKYELTPDDYLKKRMRIVDLCNDYATAIDKGQSEEHARELLPQCIRQNFVVSFNARSLLHLVDLRAVKDAQLEIRQFSELLFGQFKDWMPEVANWYADKRLGKNKLAP